MIRNLSWWWTPLNPQSWSKPKTTNSHSFVCPNIVPICRLQDTYKQTEIEFFRLLMKEMAMAEEHSLRKISVLNIMNPNRNKDVNLTMGQLEKLLTDWIEEGYFYEQNGHVYFGVRSVAEFGEFLRNKFNVDSCHLCKTVLLKVILHRFLLSRPQPRLIICTKNFRELTATEILATGVSTPAVSGSTWRKMQNVQSAKKFGALQYHNTNRLNLRKFVILVTYYIPEVK